jgi:hypothetical protein
LSENAIRDFEDGRRDLSANDLTAIQRALEAAGVELLSGERAGVRLKGT